LVLFASGTSNLRSILAEWPRHTDSSPLDPSSLGDQPAAGGPGRFALHGLPIGSSAYACCSELAAYRFCELSSLEYRLTPGDFLSGLFTDGDDSPVW